MCQQRTWLHTSTASATNAAQPQDLTCTLGKSYVLLAIVCAAPIAPATDIAHEALHCDVSGERSLLVVVVTLLMVVVGGWKKWPWP